jgi:D-alanine--poly(phosphoribitol) ligase subunit 2
MKEKIIEIIIKLTGYEELKENENIDLIENDILDSLSFIELIAELEEEFNIEIQPTQIPSDVWRSIDNINKMVNEKLERNGK